MLSPGTAYTYNKLAFAFGNVLWQQKFKHFFFFFQKLKRLKEAIKKTTNSLK